VGGYEAPCQLRFSYDEVTDLYVYASLTNYTPDECHCEEKLCRPPKKSVMVLYEKKES
jgi:hypothetical protein